MDLHQVYPGAVPLDIDLLQPQRNVEIALGFALQATFGTGTVIDGLAVTQTIVPSMQVLVGPGSIITSTTVDTLTTGFGSLPLDNTDSLVKIGINLTSTTLAALTAPPTAGQSQNWLIEAQFIESDSSPVTLPFYNAANPAVPFSGPNNSGAASNTARTQRVQLQYKAGAPAATGSQLTPAPDAGWVGVAVVTVANGQATITNANITQYSGAPIVPTKLPYLRIKLTAPLTLYVSPSGSDLNSGLAASVPFATLQKAWNTIINSYDLNGYNVVVNIANGTYTTGLVCSGVPVGSSSGNSISFIGNNASPSSVVISTTNAHALAIVFGANVFVSGMTLQAAGALSPVPPSGLVVTSGGNCTINGPMIFGNCVAAQIYGTGAGQIGASVPYTIAGSAQYHYDIAGGAILSFINLAIPVTGNPNFSVAFAGASLSATLQLLGCSFSGGATGQRFTVGPTATINTGGAGPNFFPGSIAGTQNNGGVYL